MQHLYPQNQRNLSAIAQIVDVQKNLIVDALHKKDANATQDIVSAVKIAIAVTIVNVALTVHLSKEA